MVHYVISPGYAAGKFQTAGAEQRKVRLANSVYVNALNSAGVAAII